MSDLSSFALAVAAYQTDIADGLSSPIAARNATQAYKLDPAWNLVLMGFVNNSPITAEAWAKRIMQDKLDNLFNPSTGAIRHTS